MVSLSGVGNETLLSETVNRMKRNHHPWTIKSTGRRIPLLPN